MKRIFTLILTFLLSTIISASELSKEKEFMCIMDNNYCENYCCRSNNVNDHILQLTKDKIQNNFSYLKNMIEKNNVNNNQLTILKEELSIIKNEHEKYFNYLSNISTLVIGLFGAIFIVGVVYSYREHQYSKTLLQINKQEWDAELNKKIKDSEKLIEDLSRKFENDLKIDLHEYKLRFELAQNDLNKDIIYSHLKEISISPSKKYLSIYEKLIELDINKQITDMATESINKLKET